MNTIKIAIAEDHKMLRQSLIGFLNSYDDISTDIEAKDGKELLTKFKYAKQLPDVCIMDINMPGMNGVEATKQIALHYPSIKVLAVTMYDDDFNILRMLQNGACGYVPKMNGIEDLYNAIQMVYKHGFYSCNVIANALKIMMRCRVERTKSPMLTEKEILFLSLCCTDLSYREIAAELCISPNTIQNYTDEINRKIKLSTRLEFAMFAIRVGIVSPGDRIQL